MWYTESIQNLLTPQDADRLRAIYEPVVVAVPPDDSRRGICVMPDGEIRCYGVLGKAHAMDHTTRGVYLSSRNGGLCWTLQMLPDGTAATNSVGAVQPNGTLAMGAASRAPWSGRYVTVVAYTSGERQGTWALLSDIGPGDPAPNMRKISDEAYHDLFQPVAMVSRKRWIVTTYRRDGWNCIPTVLLSDDDGESWQIVSLRSTPKHTVVYPHRGTRWQNNGTEPTVCELPDGRLMLLARTSLDYFYVYYSSDGGESWTEGEPSRFHGTLTTPFFLRLQDGRVVLFWNNARPLAEPDHTKTVPPVTQYVIDGLSEDAFTNRDVNHAAITADGEVWRGFREIGLNELRNAPDFRMRGGTDSSADKSVHQFQAIELPFGKVLVSYGQNRVARKLVIFDVNWLYERSRSEDFEQGLEGLTTHLFVKSLSDCQLWRGHNGHCAWNRTNGALLVPDPDPAAIGGEALQICRIHDRRLVSEKQGAVWNFPMARRGELTLDIRVDGAGVSVRLCDHWMNAGDEDVGLWARYDFALDRRVLPAGQWCEVRIVFDTDAGMAEVFNGETRLFAVPMRLQAPDGISYLHLQTMAESEDFEGTYIRRLAFCGQDD